MEYGFAIDQVANMTNQISDKHSSLFWRGAIDEDYDFIILTTVVDTIKTFFFIIDPE
jgi:hypothetical protein